MTIVDGAASETDAWEVRAHRPLMISNVVLHSLPAGYRFDLRRRKRVAAPVLHHARGRHRLVLTDRPEKRAKKKRRGMIQAISCRREIDGPRRRPRWLVHDRWPGSRQV